MKSQPIAYSLSGSEHIYGILDLEGEVHLIRVLWTMFFWLVFKNKILSRAARGVVVVSHGPYLNLDPSS